MAYKPVGVDEDGDFPQKVRTKLDTIYATKAELAAIPAGGGGEGGATLVALPAEIDYTSGLNTKGLGLWDTPTNLWAFSSFSEDGIWQAEGTRQINLVAGRWLANDGTLMVFNMSEATNGKPSISLSVEDYDAGTSSEIAMYAENIYMRADTVILPNTTTATRPATLTTSDSGAIAFDKTTKTFVFWTGTAYYELFQSAGSHIQLPNRTTALRPTGLTASNKGATLYDSTLNKPIVWNGTAWTDYVGTVV